MSDDQMEPLSVKEFNGIAENQRYEHFAKRCCKFVSYKTEKNTIMIHF